jgi:hypothetical protein
MKELIRRALLNDFLKQSVARARPPIGPLRVDLVRGCAPHNKPWAAIYMRQKDGSYAYQESIRVRGRVYQLQYAEPEETYAIDLSMIGDEECAWCGYYGVPFHCHSHIDGSGCQMMVCQGLSTGRYLRCRCGKEGWAHPSWPKQVGIVIGSGLG